MKKFLKWLDEIAAINQANSIVKWLERIAFIFLILMALSAPHSIAATQISWLTGMTAWFIRLFFKPRLQFTKTPLNFALLALFLWSFVTAFFSYAPDISFDKLRNVGLLFIFFFVINNLRTKNGAILIASALIFSCCFNVVWTPLERLIGRGVEVSGIQSDSLFYKADFLEKDQKKMSDGDAILEVDKKKVRSPEELVAEIEKKELVTIKIYRPDYYNLYQLKQADLLNGKTALEKLGISSWKTSRNWRSQAFYSHFTTYAEVLQLIASLVFGLLIASFGSSHNRKWQIILSVILGFMLLALLMTVTRASQASFLISSFFMVLCGASRKMFLGLLAIALPVGLIGLYVLQQSRDVGFYDTKDNSITWRQTVYREGFDLAISSPRHLLVGVGMDSIKRFAGDWHLFDDGRLPKGHFHSTPLQLLVERGIPALIIWLWILWLYGNTLWRRLKTDNFSDWREKGIILGCFGGLIGFFTGGLVHYNLGDGEVAMVFFLLMGVSVFLSQKLIDK